MNRGYKKLKSSDDNKLQDASERFIKSLIIMIATQTFLSKIAFPVIGKLGTWLKGGLENFVKKFPKTIQDAAPNAIENTGKTMEDLFGEGVSDGAIDAASVFQAMTRSPEFEEAIGELLERTIGETVAVALADVGIMASKVLEAIFGAVTAIADPLEVPLLVMMIVGMIFDALDPCNTAGQITYSQFNQFGKEFNNNFRRTMLMTQKSNFNQFGMLEFSRWPLTYSPTAPGGVLDTYKKYNDAELKLEAALMVYYLSNLETNANGENIMWNPNYKRNTNGTISGVQKAFNQISINIANNNRVVAAGIERFWPLILLGFIILIIIILVLINE